MNIGITGSIACGKSTVTSYLQKKGYVVLDADKIGHSVLEKKDTIEELKTIFGLEILTNDKIDRLKLGKVVFGNKDALVKLNKVVHPKIREEILLLEDKYKDEKLLFVDAALLFEANFADLVEKVIVVNIDEKTQLKRLMDRNNFPISEAKKRIASQMSGAEKAKLADYIIDNSGTFEETYREIEKTLQKISEGK